MALELHAQLAPVLTHHASPQLVAFAHLLGVTGAELDEEVNREVERNPALVRERSAPAPPLASAPDLPARETRAQRLESTMRTSLPAADIPLGTYLIGSLDERGFLDRAPDAIARELGVASARLQSVLDLIRACGPAGIAARDARECLLLQIDRLARGGKPVDPLARALVSEHLHALARGRLHAVTTALGATEHDVKRALRFIRDRLRPYPLDDGDAADEPVPAALPAIAFRASSDGFAVEVGERVRVRLSLDPLYAALASGAMGSDPAARAHAARQVLSASAFLTRLGQRWDTLRRLGEVLAREQAGFLRDGPRALRPLTRAAVARELGLHDSTISRAVSGKFAALPSGRLAPLGDFFRPALGTHDTLRALIASEERPLSDRELSARLGELGCGVSRRTVAKYRTSLRVPPVHLR